MISCKGGILQTSKQHGWSYIQDIDVDLNDGNVFVTAAQVVI